MVKCYALQEANCRTYLIEITTFLCWRLEGIYIINLSEGDDLMLD